jgi:hypothetical protein
VGKYEIGDGKRFVVEAELLSSLGKIGSVLNMNMVKSIFAAYKCKITFINCWKYADQSFKPLMLNAFLFHIKSLGITLTKV